MIGQRISHYQVLEKLGEGGMGAVYLAEDARLGRKVALKILAPEMAEDPARLQRFEREAKAVAALNHPNIVTIHSVEEADGVRFLTMERVDGVGLDRRITSAGMTVNDFLEIAIPLASALNAAHERGITHRDLKPANVMVTRDGQVKVLDFGLAKRHGGEAGDGDNEVTQALTQEGVVMGTVPYMSPEQVQGRAADQRSDIFSLGVIYYELLTGSRPFHGDSSADVVSAILRDVPRNVTEIKVELPNHLGRIVRRCLEKEPTRRYQTARDLLNELEELGKEGVRDQDQSRSVAVLPFADMSPEKDQDYFCEGIAEELINGLGRIGHLRVASRTSSFQFKGAASDIREIGDKLAVNTVLEGSVRKAGDRVRITAQLVNVADGYRLWSDRYDRELKDVFAIQDEIAESIVKALQVTLSPRERRAIQNVATRDVEAYEYYLRGRKYFYEMRKTSFEYARRMYESAIEVDPSYALAYTGIADCCSFLYMYNESSKENRELADQASAKALELDPDLAEAHASRGLALSLGKRFKESTAEFETATRLNPKLFDAYYFWARDCMAQGNLEKAAELFRKASEVRPEDYQAPLILVGVLRGLGAPEAELSAAAQHAIKTVTEYVKFNPGDARALNLGAISLIEVGQREKGLDWSRQAIAIDPTEPQVLYNSACVHAVAGEADRAIQYLENAVDNGYGHWDWLENDPDFESLRDDPRFQALLARPREGGSA